MRDHDIGAIPVAFIRPGLDKEYPGSGLHIKASHQDIKIYPEGQSDPLYMVDTYVNFGGVMRAGLRTRDRFRRRMLPVFGREFLLFALEYFDRYAQVKPTSFHAMWWKGKGSINMAAYTRQMKWKEDTAENRLNAASKTWTARSLRDVFTIQSATWSMDHGHLDVWFLRK